MKSGPLKLTLFLVVFTLVFFTMITEFKFPLDLFNGNIKIKWTHAVAATMVIFVGLAFVYLLLASVSEDDK